MTDTKLKAAQSRVSDLDSEIECVRDKLEVLKDKRLKERARLKDLERAERNSARMAIRDAFASDNGYPADGALFILIYNRAALRCDVEDSTFLQAFEAEETLAEEVVAAVNGDLERQGFSR